MRFSFHSRGPNLESRLTSLHVRKGRGVELRHPTTRDGVVSWERHALGNRSGLIVYFQ